MPRFGQLCCLITIIRTLEDPRLVQQPVRMQSMPGADQNGWTERELAEQIASVIQTAGKSIANME